MQIAVDLHAHSGYAGGVKNISIEHLASSMMLKGVDVLGTGDCLFPKWRGELKDSFTEENKGIFAINSPKTSHYGLSPNELKAAKFILQTELIFTFAEPLSRARKRMDVVFLFPSFGAVDAAINLLEKWGVKNTVGRPFVVCQNGKNVGDKIRQILAINEWIEAVPAHVMTPQGIFGSPNKIDSLSVVFGDEWNDIHAIETGLSANPKILEMIPELNNLAFISNSDLHSANLDKLGRELTCLEVRCINYQNIIQSIRLNKIVYTFELSPEEGRYYFTGHKGSRPGHDGTVCIYSPSQTPKNYKCPVCNKELYIGVLERAEYLKQGQQAEGVKRSRKFITTVPLFEIIQHLGCKGQQAYFIYRDTIEPFGNEKNLWLSNCGEINNKLHNRADQKVIDAVLEVKKGNFCFNPPGCDGERGELAIGEKLDFSEFKIEPENLKANLQLELF